VANTLAYYDTATITAVKSFIVQAPVWKCMTVTLTHPYPSHPNTSPTPNQTSPHQKDKTSCS